MSTHFNFFVFKKKSGPLQATNSQCGFLESKEFHLKDPRDREIKFEYKGKSLRELSEYLLKPCIYKRR